MIEVTDEQLIDLIDDPAAWNYSLRQSLIKRL